MLVSSLSVWPRLAYPSWISLWTTESHPLSSKTGFGPTLRYIGDIFPNNSWITFHFHNTFLYSLLFITDLTNLYPSYQTLSYLKADLVLSLLGVALDGVGRRHRWRVDVAVIRHDQTVAPVVHLHTGQVYLCLCFSTIYYRWHVVGDIG